MVVSLTLTPMIHPASCARTAKPNTALFYQ